MRKRRLRRSLAICAMAAIVLAATLVWTRRATDERIASSAPTAAETSAAPAAVPLPETARPVIAAPEPARRVTARTRVPDPMRPDATESQPADGGTEAQRLELPPRASAAPTDTPSAAPAPSTPDVRVEVAQKVDGPNIDYTVRLFRPGGGPVTGADVRLRGVTTDGMLVEAPLQPAGPPGVYHALLAFSARGPKGLTLRIARADGVLEVPVAPAPSGSPPGSR